MATTLLTCDTSVVVAGLTEWHPDYLVSRRRLAEIAWVPAQVIAESVSVLSRLPNGSAIDTDDAIGLMRGLARGRIRQLSGARYLLTFDAVAVAGLAGGAVYDAIVGATAREHDATLLTLDRRARRTYSAVGATFELIA